MTNLQHAVQCLTGAYFPLDELIPARLCQPRHKGEARNVDRAALGYAAPITPIN
jgi:hypothetical protein